VDHPPYVSSDGGVGFKALGPCDSEEGRERGGRKGMDDNGDTVSSWSHMAKTEKGKEGDDSGQR
jgi:hypothetical protein